MNLFGLAVDALFVNRILPAEVQDPFFAGWKAEQAEHRQQVRQIFAPLPVFEVALRPGEVLGQEALRRLGEEVYAGHDPAERLSREEALRFICRAGSAHDGARRGLGRQRGGAPSWKSTATS